MLMLEKYQPAWVSIKDINTENQHFQYREELIIEELIDSLKNEGQKFPVILWRRNVENAPRHAGSDLQLISGFRRLSAAKSLDREKIFSVIIPENKSF